MPERPHPEAFFSAESERIREQDKAFIKDLFELYVSTVRGTKDSAMGQLVSYEIQHRRAKEPLSPDLEALFSNMTDAINRYDSSFANLLERHYGISRTAWEALKDEARDERIERRRAMERW